MNIGSISTNLQELPPERGLALLGRLGIRYIELGCGGYFMDRRYGDPASLLGDDDALARWQNALAEAGVSISALAVHGAPLSPDSNLAAKHTSEYRRACELADAIGVTRITLLAGLPEARAGDHTPCWIVTSDPEENVDMLEWQWEARVLPYWEEQIRVAEHHGCVLCFEMAPSDVAHNPRGLLRLREAFGPVVGCNLDPSHLFWQGIDPIVAIRALGGAIYHTHVKDTEIRPEAAVNGVLDARAVVAPERRAWNFRTVGRGHDRAFWAAYVRALQEAGYDDVLSIEHEDVSIPGVDGLVEATGFLKPILAGPTTGR